jgi:protein-S-isoprenylcysteine O-methyltransferase Ste14
MDGYLVTTGPYRWVRHPFYVSVLLLVCGAALLAANWFIGVCGLLVFALQAIRTRIEERKLVERFGEEYRLYMKRTGRFAPRFW